MSFNNVEHTVIVESLLLDRVEGFITIVLPEVSPQLRLTTVVFLPGFDMDDEAAVHHFKLGSPSKRDLRLHWSQSWRPGKETERVLRQPRRDGAVTSVSGQVVELTSDGFRVDCGVLLDVELETNLPSIGAWVSLNGTLVSWDSGFFDPPLSISERDLPPSP